jgi:dolichyl-phosphate beta-glucosyltransferase
MGLAYVPFYLTTTTNLSLPALLSAISDVALFQKAYIFLVVFSPSPFEAIPSEKMFLSASSPAQPQPLPSIFGPASVDISLVIPAYNESLRLPPMLETTLDHLSKVAKSKTKAKSKSKSRSTEIIIVDDGSKDSTSTVALSLATANPSFDIRVVRLRTNRGKGAAVKHGFLHARGKRILMVDADGASKFEDLELLWEEMDKIEKDGQGVVVGSRAHLVGTEAVVKVCRTFRWL